MIQTQYDTQTHILRSDNGGVYIKPNMKQFISQIGLIHQNTYSGTPLQNGVAERKKHTLLKITKSTYV